MSFLSKYQRVRDSVQRAIRHTGCFLLGHSWQRESEFTGGITYECKRCKRGYTSFITCPSYQVHHDYWFDCISTRTLWDRIRGRERRHYV